MSFTCPVVAPYCAWETGKISLGLWDRFLSPDLPCLVGLASEIARRIVGLWNTSLPRKIWLPDGSSLEDSMSADIPLGSSEDWAKDSEDPCFSECTGCAPRRFPPKDLLALKLRCCELGPKVSRSILFLPL